LRGKKYLREVELRFLHVRRSQRQIRRLERFALVVRVGHFHHPLQDVPRFLFLVLEHEQCAQGQHRGRELLVLLQHIHEGLGQVLDDGLFQAVLLATHQATAEAHFGDDRAQTERSVAPDLHEKGIGEEGREELEDRGVQREMCKRLTRRIIKIMCSIYLSRSLFHTEADASSPPPPLTQAE